MLDWYKRKQVISDSGRFLPRANCREQRNRLMQAEAILERYDNNKDTIRVLDVFRLLFSIQSISCETTWYTVSMQCSYCDRSNVATRCKHLLGIEMMIKKHMTELKGSLLIINHAMEIHFECSDHIDDSGDNIIATTQANLELKITTLKDALVRLENNKHTLALNVSNTLSEKMDEFTSILHGLFPPSLIEMPRSTSIKMQQQNVTVNRMGRHASRYDGGHRQNLETIIMVSLPPKDKRSMGAMQKLGDKSRKRVPFRKNSKVRCAHCECNNLVVTDASKFHCVHCESLLPLIHEEATSVNLKGKKVMLEIERNVLMPSVITD